MTHLNDLLKRSKKLQRDEYYTQYKDVEAACAAFDPKVFEGKTILLPCNDSKSSAFYRFFVANMTVLGIKKVLAVSYDPGVLRTVTTTGVQVRKLDHLGDFRSAEVTALRDEADIIVTNPPFSLFREFFVWVAESEKKFLIVGPKTAATFKEVLEKIIDHQTWFGPTIPREFRVPEVYTYSFTDVRTDQDGQNFVTIKNACWFTNIEHGSQPKPLQLNTMETNLQQNVKLRRVLEERFGQIEYPKYDNYDAIEVPLTEAIPSDYDGVMGVPVTFLNKYNPDQFEILSGWNSGVNAPNPGASRVEWVDKHGAVRTSNGPFVAGRALFFRVLIRARL